MRSRLFAMAFLMVPAPVALATAQTPLAVLQAARIVSGAAVDVGVAPAVVTLEIKAASPVNVSEISFGLRSPSGHQVIVGRQTFSSGVTSFDGLVQTRFGGGGLGPHGLNLYSQPGIWTLDYVTVCAAPPLCTRTSGAALASLVSPLTVTVTNSGHPVITLPIVTSAAILTTSLAQSYPFPGDPSFAQVAPFQVAVNATADTPGIVQAQAWFAPPANPPCSGVSTPPVILRGPDLGVPAPAYSRTLTSRGLSCFSAAGLLGTYTVNRLRVADEAGNVLDITSPARLHTLFSGGTTVTVTAH